MRDFSLILAAGLLWAGVVSAADAPPVLSLPLDCGGGRVCVLARTTDHDPAKGPTLDYRCGPRAGGDHDGTDIAVRDMVDGAQTPVLAAAPGIVAGVRDGMEDRSTRTLPPGTDIKQACGNGVRIDHGNGWATQYCHLRRGSLRVKAGQQVERGQDLGRVGMSGMSEFPHLHLSVFHQDKPIDPFTGGPAAEACNSPGTPLWDAAAQAALPYVSRGFYHAGVAAGPPNVEAARDGAYRQPPGREAPALVVWTELLAAGAGDRLRLILDGPGGRLLDKESVLEANKVQWFAFAGLNRPPRGWPPGAYRAEVRLIPADGSTLPPLETRWEMP